MYSFSFYSLIWTFRNTSIHAVHKNQLLEIFSSIQSKVTVLSKTQHCSFHFYKGIVQGQNSKRVIEEQGNTWEHKQLEEN